MNDPELLEQVTRKIVERFHPRRIILFGSQARGEATSESDLDLFIEMETQARPPERAVEVSSILDCVPGPSTSLSSHLRKSKDCERLMEPCSQ